ncbi:MAG: rhodanese-like domain-containing protein [Bacteroidetes bacterium]|nr:rhodanese-like domain-containing protein [Bacteroidota bacterium]
MMKHSFCKISVLFTLLVLLGCSRNEIKVYDNEISLINEAKADVEMITPEDFKAILESHTKYYLIDCREEIEYDSSSIPGAINIPKGLLEFQIGNKVPERRTDIYIYCSDGQRSVIAASILPQLKFPNVKVISDGFNLWKQKYPELVETEHPGAAPKSNSPPVSSGGCGG